MTTVPGHGRLRALAIALVAIVVAAGCVSGGAGSAPPAPRAAADASSGAPPPGLPASTVDSPGAPGAPGAPGGPGATAPSSQVRPTTPSSEPDAVQATVVSRSLWPGRGTVLLALEDAANAPVGGPDLVVRVAVRPADGGEPRAWVDARYERLAADGRGLYAADLDLPGPGEVSLAVEATAFGVAHRTVAVARVRDPGETPAIGALAPRTETPTYASADGDLARVTTDPVPDARLYWLSPRAAIELGRPFVLVIDSFAFRPSPACGGALGIVHHLADEYPAVSFIHAEAYATRVAGGRLVADPPGGPLRPAAWAREWGATTAPWVFVVDASGIVRAKFSGIVGTDEIRAAIRSVAGWVPTW